MKYVNYLLLKKTYFLILISLLFIMFTTCYYIAYKYTNPVKYTAEHILEVKKQHEQLMKDNAGATVLAFTTSDGIRINALALKRSQARYNLVICHGYSRDWYDACALTHLLDDCNIMLFDFRGHGNSQITTTSLGAKESHDVSAVLLQAKNYFQYTNLPMIVLGFSMGAAALLGAVSQGAHCDGIILDSCFDTLALQIKRVFKDQTGLPIFPFYYISSLFFYLITTHTMSSINPVAWAKGIKIPALVIHAQDDDFTPISCSYKLQHALGGPVQTWYPVHAPHALANKYYPLQYKNAIRHFLESECAVHF